MNSTLSTFSFRRFGTSEVKDIDGFQASDFELVGYSPHGAPHEKNPRNREGWMVWNPWGEHGDLGLNYNWRNQTKIGMFTKALTASSGSHGCWFPCWGWVGCSRKPSSGKLFLVELKNSGTQFVSEPWCPRDMPFFLLGFFWMMDFSCPSNGSHAVQVRLKKPPTMTLHSSWVIYSTIFN